MSDTTDSTELREGMREHADLDDAHDLVRESADAAAMWDKAAAAWAAWSPDDERSRQIRDLDETRRLLYIVRVGGTSHELLGSLAHALVEHSELLTMREAFMLARDLRNAELADSGRREQLEQLIEICTSEINRRLS